MVRRNMICRGVGGEICPRVDRAPLSSGALFEQYQAELERAWGLPNAIGEAWEDVPNGAHESSRYRTSHHERVERGCPLPADIAYQWLQASLTERVMHMLWICQQGIASAASIDEVSLWMSRAADPDVLYGKDGLDALEAVRDWRSDHRAMLDDLRTFGGEPLMRHVKYAWTLDGGRPCWVRTWDHDRALVAYACGCGDRGECFHDDTDGWGALIVYRGHLEVCS